jgi:hypothetical protein
LTKAISLLYSKDMNRFIVSQKPKINENSKKISNTKDFISFVANEFKKLSKRNLRVPIQLYQL